MNGGEQGLPTYFRWRVANSLPIRIDCQRQIGRWHDCRHWFSFSRNPRYCSPWLAILQVLTLLLYICPAWPDPSVPACLPPKPCPSSTPSHSCTAAQRTLYLDVVVERWCSIFSFTPCLLQFLQSKLCSLDPVGLLFRYSKACLEVLKKRNT